MIFLSIILFLISFLFYYYPIVKYKYPTAWIDAEDHAFSITLFKYNPLLFFRSLVSLEKFHSPYHQERFIAISTNPSLFYIAGAFFSLFPINELNVAYFTATFLVALSTPAIFLILNSLTKKLWLSFFTSLIFGINLVLATTLHQGLYAASSGVLFFILSLYFFYKSIKYFEYKNLIISTLFLSLTATYYFIPLIFSFSLFFLLLLLIDRKFLKTYFNNFFNDIKKRKYYLILFAITIFYIYRSFSIFGNTTFGNELISIDKIFGSYNVPFIYLLWLIPNYSILLLISAIIISIYSIFILFKSKTIDETIFILLSTSSLIILTIFYIPDIKLSVFLSEHLVKLINILPFFLSVSFAFTFSLLSKKIPAVILIILFVSLSYMTFFSDRYLGYISFYNDKPIMDDYKYEAIKFIKENTNEDSKVLISIPFSFPTFFHREYSYFDNTTNIKDYNYIIAFRDNSTFVGQIVYENQELKIMKIS